MTNPQHLSALAALEWHIENGADEALSDQPVDRTAMPELPKADAPAKKVVQMRAAAEAPPAVDLMGAAESKVKAVELAKACATLDDLQQAIKDFDGLSIKKTATNMVFCDGNPAAPVMLIGEAPGADEDKQGKPFVGVSGQLLDRILACIDLDRTEEEAAKAVYISNILNWRPPGNRTPIPAEIDIALPFIERHIALVKPKLLILCGGIAAKSLLASDESVSKLRGLFHDYKPLTPGIAEQGASIPALATYHPAYLLRTPSQKRAVWADMLLLQQKMRDMGLK